MPDEVRNFDKGKLNSATLGASRWAQRSLLPGLEMVTRSLKEL